ncbi:MAG: FlgB family protein [Hasllibacter sp.]
MFERIPILAAGSALARHAETRTTLTARNLANADTPGWRPSRLEAFDLGMAQGMRTTRPGHVAAGATPRTVVEPATQPNGNGVSVEREMVEAARARADHELAVGAWRGALGILRSGIGR